MSKGSITEPKTYREWMIPLIFLYLLALLLFATYSIGAMELGWLPAPYAPLRVPLMCGAIAYVGGCLYCFRAVYLNKCVRKQWDPDWHIWYFIRPITSTIAGAVSYLFLKAGLLVLESSSNEGASEIGFFALAFIAGFNVDKFVAKIEEVAKAVWGIDKSRSASVRDNESTVSGKGQEFPPNSQRRQSTPLSEKT
ncbi:hypothetical protein ACVD0V_23780 [Pseudomonas aeruginosa]|uniref:hypothetical protein n=1 Tax=Pseudomonas aeruginosa TaxID=287 RepID=UPI00376ECAEB